MHFHFMPTTEHINGDLIKATSGWVYRFNFSETSDHKPDANGLPSMSQFSQGSWEEATEDKPARPDFAEMQTGVGPTDLMCFIENLAREIGADVVDVPRAPGPVMSSALSLGGSQIVGTGVSFGFRRFPKEEQDD